MRETNEMNVAEDTVEMRILQLKISARALWFEYCDDIR